MLRALKSRLPGRGEIGSVYAVTAFMLFTWSLLWFFWSVPSWIKFMTVGTLLATLSYAAAASFLESLTLLALLLAAAILLPSAWFRERFAARGVAVTLGLLGTIMMREYFGVLKPQSTFGLALTLTVAVLLFLVAKFQWAEKALILLSDRLTIFLYIFIPLSVLSILNILLRNLLP